MVVVDTSILIDHLRGRPLASEALGRHHASGGVVLGSVLTRTELLAGGVRSQRAALAELFAAVTWIDVDLLIADRAGALARQFHRSHPGIDTAEFVIAATAIEMNATLWTRNVRHFPMFPDLPRLYE
jgi:predicted nucleic acid-binding protein